VAHLLMGAGVVLVKKTLLSARHLQSPHLFLRKLAGCCGIRRVERELSGPAPPRPSATPPLLHTCPN